MSENKEDVTITLKNTEDGRIRVTIDYGGRWLNFGNYAHCIATKMVERYAEANDDIDIWVV